MKIKIASFVILMMPAVVIQLFSVWYFVPSMVIGGALAVSVAILRHYIALAEYNINQYKYVATPTSTLSKAIRRNNPVDVPVTSKQNLIGFNDTAIKEIKNLLYPVIILAIGFGCIPAVLTISLSFYVLAFNAVYCLSLMWMMWTTPEIDGDQDDNSKYNKFTSAVIHDPKDRIPLTANIL